MLMLSLAVIKVTAGINNWIPVKNNHSENIRCKNTPQLNTLITLSDSFAVLDNLYESPDKGYHQHPEGTQSLACTKQQTKKS